MTTAGIVGAAGYIGGELLRLLLGHPKVTVAVATSSRLAGRRVDRCHPNLRGLTELRFTGVEAAAPCDVLFIAGAHLETMERIDEYAELGGVLVDLSADFRIADPAEFARRYGRAHSRPELLGEFAAGLPELHREALRGRDRISVPGCMATAAILALHPLAAEGWITGEVHIDARTGSSGSGARATDANRHAERSGAMRVFAPLGHRHEAEIGAAIGHRVRMTATGVEAVRGVQVVCRTRIPDGVDEAAVRRAFRRRYDGERFVRVVAGKSGLHRLPDPKILTGSNYADVGFAVDGDTVVAVGALDNLVKGGAGNAVQSLNAVMGWPEQTGLEFPGLHPI